MRHWILAALAVFAFSACELRVRDLGNPTSDQVVGDAAIADRLPAVWETPPLLDDFNGVPGILTGSNAWTLDKEAYTVNAGALGLAISEDRTLLWGTRGGRSQAMQLKVVRPAQTGEIDMLFKAALSARMRHLDVAWNADKQTVEVFVSDDQNQHTSVHEAVAVRLNAGDTIGAEVSEVGLVKVFHNGNLLVQADAIAWPFHADDGYFGLRIAFDTNAQFDDFRAR